MLVRRCALTVIGCLSFVHAILMGVVRIARNVGWKGRIVHAYAMCVDANLSIVTVNNSPR